MKLTITCTFRSNVHKRATTILLALLFCFSVYAQPVISGFSPSTGPSGTTVTITGTGFSATLADNHVWLGGARCNVLTASTTVLTVRVPNQVLSNEQFLFTNSASNLSCYSMNKFLLNYSGSSGFSYNTASFTDAVNYTIGDGGGQFNNRLAFYDINADDKLDILSYTASGLDILTNQSVAGSLTSASFARTTVTTNISYTGTSFGRIHTLLSDFNSDGKIDFFNAMNGYSPYSQVNINNSSGGTFSVMPSAPASTSAEASSVNILDINLDGRMDFMGGYSTGASINFGRNTSTGVDFSMQSGKVSPYVTNVDKSYLLKADLNFDGKEDLIIGSTNSIYSKLELRRNATTVNESTITNFSFVLDQSPAGPAYNARDLQAADLDGDGKLDIVQSYGTGGRIAIWRNTTATSGGNISVDTYYEVLFPGMGSTNGMAIADMNADGKPDIIVAASVSTTGTLYYLENTSSGTGNISFAAPVAISTSVSGNVLYSLAVFDFDEDGYLDIVGATNGANAVRVFRNSMAPTVRINTTDYQNMKAAFDAINAGAHTGDISVEIYGNPLEAASAILNASGTGSADYASVHIYPTATNLMINSNFAGITIDLNGADNVTIDGRVNGTGSSRSLTIANSNNAASATIRLNNSAENNVLKYCTIIGETNSATLGSVVFGTASGGNGNSGNIIEYCDFTKASTGTVSTIYSAGSASPANNNNIIRNNNFYDLIRTSASSTIIQLASNTTNTIISDNSFYETGTRTIPGAFTYQMIRINSTSVTGVSIENNYIGGAGPMASGSAMDLASVYAARLLPIYNAGGSAANPVSIQNNTIRNISFSSASGPANNGGYFSAILIEGASYTNIGTATGNNIGDQSSTGSIVLKPQGISNYAYGIHITAGTSVNIRNNKIGSITLEGPNTVNKNFVVINDNASSGTHVISNNILGSPTTANSIQCLSNNSIYGEYLYGIQKYGTISTLTISGNTIANLSMSPTASGTKQLYGIHSFGSGNLTVTNNTIFNLSTSSINNGIETFAALAGISLSGGSAYTATGNTIYNLSATGTSGTMHSYGIFFGGSTATPSLISNNFIHSITCASSNTSAHVSGIYVLIGLAQFSNNIINLGSSISTGLILYGIVDAGSSSTGSARTYYHNSIYLEGTVTDGSNTSALRFSNAAPTGRNIRNNILYNNRSNSAGTAKHYALFITGAPATTTFNYNNYYTPGSGGVLASYNGADITALPLTAGQDNASLVVDPSFVNTGGTLAADHKPTIDLTGISIAGINRDYEGTARASIPTIGAFESVNLWSGNTNTDFATGSNWSRGAMPGTGQHIVFSSTAANDLILDQDRTTGNVSFSTANKKLILGNYSLTASAIMDADANNYIQSTGTGKLFLNVMNGSTRSFPVGNSTYNPVSITNNSGSSDDFSVRVMDAVYSDGSSGTLSAYPRINRTWDIGKASANAGAGVDFTFEWEASQNAGVIVPALYHHDGSKWTKQTSGTSTSPTSTSFTYTGYDGSFSPFAIFETSAALPLVWKSFTAQKQGEKAVLNWQTFNEQNTRDFTIQHSTDGRTWRAVGNVKAAGFSMAVRNYSFIHSMPENGDNFYRIIQSDLDDRSDYSKTAYLQFAKNMQKMQVYPNPVVNHSLTLQLPQATVIKLFNSSGMLILTKKYASGIQKMDVSRLSRGVYHLKAGNETISIVIQ